jgi:hypothetical protein
MRWNKLCKADKASCWFANKALLWPCFIFLFSSSASYAADLISYTNAKLYHVRHTACSYNKNITTMTNLELNVPLPENWPDCKVSNIKITGDDPFPLHNTEGPGQIYRTTYRNGLPKKGTVAYISAEYDVQLWEVNAKYDDLMRQSYPEYTKDAEYEYYMRLPSDIGPNNPEVQPILDELRQKGRGHPVVYAKAVYDWIGQNIQYANPRPAEDLKICFRERKGDCGAIAAFFVAFCRAGGVPARFVAGCWAGEFDGWHCWAEFYLPGVGWVPIDHSPAGGFGHLSNNHLPLVKAGNMKFKVDPNQGGDSAGFVQPGYWFYWFAGGGEGGLINTEFAVESFCYADMPKIFGKEDLQKAYLKANECFAKKDYSDALRIYRYTALSEYGGKDKELLHCKMARCFLRKNQRVMASLELLPIIKEHPEKSIAKQAEEILRSARKEDVNVSSLNISRIRQGWGSPHANQSVDGKTLSIGGKKFESGIGTHAESICIIAANGDVEEFSAYVGVDDEIQKGQGSVEFFVIGDDKILWQSGIMRSGDPAKLAKVTTKDINKLMLKVGDAGDGVVCDHADWADAKMTITGIYPAIVTSEN